MEETREKEVKTESTTVDCFSYNPLYSLQEALRAVLKCLGLDQSLKPEEVDPSPSSEDHDKEFSKNSSCQASSSNTGEAAEVDPPSSTVPPADPPTTTVEDAARLIPASRPTRPPISSGNGPGTNSIPSN